MVRQPPRARGQRAGSRAKFVHAPLSLYAFPEFLRAVSSQYRVDIEPRDVAQVQREGDGWGAIGRDPSDAVAQMDLSAPAYKVLPIDGPPTRIYVVLAPDVAKRVQANIPQLASEYEAPRGGEPGMFRVKCDSVELKLTLPARAFTKSLRDAIITPFLGAYAKRHRERSPRATADDVDRVEVDGMAVSDAVKASSFASGIPLVRVQVHLKPIMPAPGEPGALEGGGGTARDGKPTAEVDDDEDGAKKPSVFKDINGYYDKWSKFSE